MTPLRSREGNDWQWWRALQQKWQIKGMSQRIGMKCLMQCWTLVLPADYFRHVYCLCKLSIQWLYLIILPQMFSCDKFYNRCLCNHYIHAFLYNKITKRVFLLFTFCTANFDQSDYALYFCHKFLDDTITARAHMGKTDTLFRWYQAKRPL